MRRLPVVVPALILVASACSTAGPQSAPAVQTSPTSTSSAEASETAAVPDELVGEWEGQKGSDPVLLILQRDGSYFVRVIVPPHRGAFSASADGTLLEFFGGYPCMDRGSYEWAVEGDTLTFTVVGEDQCPGRQSILDPLTFTRRA
jgi:hypothetical protein